ncbi:MAG: creatininase family protein [Myxococcota bacterium]
MASVELEQLTWQEAERVLTTDAVVLLPLGAGAKEHGPHLTLSNDLRLARHLTRRVMSRVDVVVAPALAFHHYPAFVEYPGSISLRAETARDVVVDVCGSLARFGPRRFYVLNTGISTVKALRPAAEELAREGVTLRWTDWAAALAPVERELCQQEGGSHADEVETSMMLHLEPEAVWMSRAVKDFQPGTGPFTRTPGGPGRYSPTGTWGDPTLASAEKGARFVTAVLEAVVHDVRELRQQE